MSGKENVRKWNEPAAPLPPLPLPAAREVEVVWAVNFCRANWVPWVVLLALMTSTAIFVPDLTLVWSCVSLSIFINRENPISVLYSTQFHPQRNTFPPSPRPLWGAPAHPERTGAALDSSKANALRGTISAARLRGRSGETTAHRDLLRGC